MITTVLLFASLICFILAAVGVKTGSLNLLALGAAFFVASFLVG